MLLIVTKLERYQITFSLRFKTKLVPAFDNWVNGSFDVTQIKEVNLEDLLERDKIELDKGYWDEKLKQKRY